MIFLGEGTVKIKLQDGFDQWHSLGSGLVTLEPAFKGAAAAARAFSNITEIVCDVGLVEWSAETYLQEHRRLPGSLKTRRLRKKRRSVVGRFVLKRLFQTMRKKPR